MKIKSTKIIMVLIMILGVMLMMLNVNVYAADYSFTTNASASKTNINEGETTTVTLNASDINMGEDGMHALEGTITYDKNAFESIEVKGNDWNVTYNESTGKFVGVNFGTTGASTSILTATLKAKGNLDSTQTGKISFSNITASAGEELVNGSAQTVNITVNAKTGSETTPSDNSQGTSKTEQTTKGADKTTTKSKIPAAGASVYLIIALALVAVISVVLIIKNRTMKDI